MSVINIIVADSHPVVVSGINEFLKSASDIRVVATYSDGVQAVQAIRDLQPAVAVIALSLPKISGLDLLATVNREQLATRPRRLTRAILSPRWPRAPTGSWEKIHSPMSYCTPSAR